MKKIGVTGGIGSGKTTVCKVFEVFGIPVFNSDLVARNLMDTDNEVKKKLVEIFGDDIYSENGLNREKMAGIVFEDKNVLEKINSIVHPAVRNAFHEWSQKHAFLPYVLQEAAILFESGANRQLDKVITVYAPEQVRIKRVVERNNISIGEVKKRIENQLPDDKKIEKSDFVINNYSDHLVIPQVLKIHQQLIE